MNQPKSQHWVPRFYLRHFATQDTRGTDHPKVWIFSSEEGDGDETLTSVRNVCAKRYLYSPRSDTRARSWDLERKLASIEDALAGLWPRLANESVDLGDLTVRRGVSLFVALMHLRNPQSLELVESVHRRLVAHYEQMPRKLDGSPDVDSVEIGGEVTPFDTADWHAYRTWGKDDHHRFFAHLIESEAIGLAELLMLKRWSVIYTEHDTLITSDKPVALQHRTRAVFGFQTPGAIVSFPISPKRLLVMDDVRNEPANQYYPLDVSARGAFNHNIWHNGSRFMITGRPVPEVLAEMVGWAESFAERHA